MQINVIKYTAKGPQSQIDHLIVELTRILDIAPHVRRASDANKKLNESMMAELPKPEEMGLPVNDPLVQALREYHAAAKPADNIKETSTDKKEEPSYEWYVNPMNSFSIESRVFRDINGELDSRTTEISRVVRDGTVKIDYRANKPELMLTIKYNEGSRLSKIILNSLNNSFERAKSRGVEINSS